MMARMVEEQFNQILQNAITREVVTERVTEIFDSTQPTDSFTGTPPLKSRTRERCDSRVKSESKMQVKAIASDRAETDIDKTTALSEQVTTSGKAENRTKSEEAHKDERKSGGVLITLAQAAAGIIAGLFLLWLLITVLRAIKLFLKPN